MSEPTGRSGVKTLAIRLPDELHAQIVLIASLEGLSLTDTIRQAISELIERKRGDGDLAVQFTPGAGSGGPHAPGGLSLERPHVGRANRSWWCTVTDSQPAAASVKRRRAYERATVSSSG